MREISRLKRYQVADYYLLGYSYGEIEAETGVSHGSIANIVQELENGKLTVAGTSLDRVSDLRQLSLDLRKKGLQPSQALLGLSLFERLRTLEITPEHLDGWSELVKRFAQPDFAPKDFFDTALRLHDLEKSQGKSFETLAEEYMKLGEEVDKLKAGADSLGKNKTELIKEIEPLHLQLESFEKTKNKLENDVKIQTTKSQELKIKVKEAEEEKSRLDRETKDLERRKAKLSSEVNGKEESLKRLNEIGLSSEDLLRLTAFIERTSKNEGISSNQVKERFFSALSLFEDVSGLENRRRAEVQQVSELVKKQSILSGEILELEKGKGILEGEIGDSISSTLQRIKEIEADAVSQIQQAVIHIKDQFTGLLEGVLRVGEAVGEMKAMQRRGEESYRELEDFLKEVKSRMEGH